MRVAEKEAAREAQNRGRGYCRVAGLARSGPGVALASLMSIFAQDLDPGLRPGSVASRCWTHWPTGKVVGQCRSDTVQVSPRPGLLNVHLCPGPGSRSSPRERSIPLLDGVFPARAENPNRRHRLRHAPDLGVPWVYGRHAPDLGVPCVPAVGECTNRRSAIAVLVSAVSWATSALRGTRSEGMSRRMLNLG